jgi:hypothetical protein
MLLLSIFNPRRHRLAHAVEEVGSKLPEGTRLGISQGPVTPHELALRIRFGTTSGDHFYKAFKTMNDAMHRSFDEGIKDFVTTPPVLPGGKNGPH